MSDQGKNPLWEFVVLQQENDKNHDDMKAVKLLLIPIVALAATLFASCGEEYAYLPDSHWILKVDGMTEGHRLALTFCGDEMRVHDASYKTPPFSTGSWGYHIDDDGMLVMSRTVYDGDGTNTESYRLRYRTDDEFNELTLVYTPWTGGARTYVFSRR